MALRSLPAPPETPTDARILEFAAEHIRRFGVERTSVTRIAEAAGMSHANVYRYYPSKTALFDEITAGWLKSLEAGLRIIADAQDPAFDKLERMVFAIHRTYRQKLEIDPKIFRLFVDAADKAAPVARRHRGRIEIELHRILDEGTGSGLIELKDAKACLLLVLDALHRFIDPAAVARDIDQARLELEERVGRALDLLRLGLTNGLNDFKLQNM
ncbi:MAG: TetR/AcrR family transcriptional regulator [Methylovirgula sp.]